LSDTADPALAAILDRQAIVDLTVTYTWTLDHGDHADLARVFTPDAYALLGGTECQGIDAIVHKVHSALGPLTTSQHIVANHQVAVDGDSATCRCYFQAQHVLHGTEGGDNFIIAGRYDDQLTRTADGWRIHHRVLTVDWSEGNSSVVRRSREGS
jgi:hypothetical protein